MKFLRIFISFTLLLYIALPLFTSADDSRAAVVRDITGEVFIKKGGGQKEFSAANGMSLAQGDTIRTEENSSANIYYDDGSKSTVGPNSRVMISQLTSQDGSKQTKTKVWAGKLWNSVQNLLNLNDEYNIETPTAVMGVRGTLFLVSTDAQTGESKLIVLDGKVAVDSANEEEDDDDDNDTSSEKIVSINETLNVGDSNDALPEVEKLDAKEFVEEVETEILTEVVNDVVKTIEEKSQQAETSELAFQTSGDKNTLLESLEKTKVASALSSIQKNLIGEIKKSDKGQDIETMLKERNYDSLREIEEKTETYEQENRERDKQLMEEAKNAGIAEEEIEEITPPSSPEITTEETANTEKDHDEDENEDSSSTPPEPDYISASIGSPVAIQPDKWIDFGNNISLDFNNNANISEDTTVTVEEVESPQIPTGTNVKPAGKVLKYTFNDTEKVNTAIADLPVKISMPVDSTANADRVGIFYVNTDGNLQYAPTTVENGIATAEVNHFSTYGVFEAEKALNPTAQPATGVLDIGASVHLTTDTLDAEIFYTTDGTNPTSYNGHVSHYNENSPPTMTGSSLTIKAVAVKNNMIASDVVTFEYSAPTDAVISGTVSLPEGEVAPEGGAEVNVYAIPSYNDGECENYLINTNLKLTIPEGQNAVDYAFSSLEDGKYYIRYDIDVNKHNHDGTGESYHINQLYYSADSPTNNYENATKLSTSTQHTNINLESYPLREISGSIKIENSLTASQDTRITVHASNYPTSGYTHVELPKGQNAIDYKIKVPFNTNSTDTKYHVYYNIHHNDEFVNHGSYESNVDLANGNISDINMAIEKGVTISGTISLPEGHAVASGEYFGVNIHGENGWTNVQIDENQNSADFTLVVSDDLTNTNLGYHLYGSQSVEKYLEQAYYVDNSTITYSTHYNDHTKIETQNGDISNIQLHIVEGYALTTNVSLPEGEVAPSGGLNVDLQAYIETQDEFGNTFDIYNDYENIKIPGGENSTQFVFYGLPKDYINLKYYISDRDGTCLSTTSTGTNDYLTDGYFYYSKLGTVKDSTKADSILLDTDQTINLNIIKNLTNRSLDYGDSIKGLVLGLDTNYDVVTIATSNGEIYNLDYNDAKYSLDGASITETDLESHTSQGTVLTFTKRSDDSSQDYLSVNSQASLLLNNGVTLSQPLKLNADNITFGAADGSTASIDGDVHVYGSNVSLQNILVNGTLYINNDTLTLSNVEATNTSVLSSTDTIGLDKTQYSTGDSVLIDLTDLEANSSVTSQDTVTVHVNSSSTDTTGFDVKLWESEVDPGYFRGDFTLGSTTFSTDYILGVSPGETITIRYTPVGETTSIQATAEIIN